MSVHHDKELRTSCCLPSQQAACTTIIILSTGGTIDKSYDENLGTLENKEPLLEKKLSHFLRLPYTHLEWVALMSKDSLYMNEDDRQQICQAIASYQELQHPMVVLHGTDTMELTVKSVSRAITAPKVPIVFTGAMKPFGFTDSDALQNVTEALIAAKLLSPGVYVSFHNHIFWGHQARKNRGKMTFEAESANP